MPSRVWILVAAMLLVAGCASPPRQLMPTPTIYRQPGGEAVFAQPTAAQGSTDPSARHGCALVLV